MSTSQANENKKVAFITGANRGIGFETARELSEKGVRVVLGVRSKENGEKAVAQLKNLGHESSYVIFDATKPETYQRTYDYLSNEFGRLDILVNNAGIWLDTNSACEGSANNTSRIDIKKIRDTFDANFFGVIESTQKLLPLLKKSSAGRIVNLSSILGSLTLHSDPKSMIYESKAFAYNASKVALNAFTVHLAHELKDTKIKVNSAHPGWVKTDMGGENAMMEVRDGGKTSVQLALLPDDGPTGGFFHQGERLPW